MGPEEVFAGYCPCRAPFPYIVYREGVEVGSFHSVYWAEQRARDEAKDGNLTLKRGDSFLKHLTQS